MRPVDGHRGKKFGLIFQDGIFSFNYAANVRCLGFGNSSECFKIDEEGAANIGCSYRGGAGGADEWGRDHVGITKCGEPFQEVLAECFIEYVEQI